MKVGICVGVVLGCALFISYLEASKAPQVPLQIADIKNPIHLHNRIPYDIFLNLFFQMVKPRLPIGPNNVWATIFSIFRNGILRTKDINYSDPSLEHGTLLHIVAPYDDAYVQLLLLLGANPNIPDANRRTPIFYVRTLEAYLALKKAGAWLNVRDEEGQSPGEYMQEQYGDILL